MILQIYLCNFCLLSDVKVTSEESSSDYSSDSIPFKPYEEDNDRTADNKKHVILDELFRAKQKETQWIEEEEKQKETEKDEEQERERILALEDENEARNTKNEESSSPDEDEIKNTPDESSASESSFQDETNVPLTKNPVNKMDDISYLGNNLTVETSDRTLLSNTGQLKNCYDWNDRDPMAWTRLPLHSGVDMPNEVGAQSLWIHITRIFFWGGGGQT